MAKLVIGTNKQTVIPAVVRDMSPTYYIEKTINNSGELVSSANNVINLSGVNKVGAYGMAYAYYGAIFPSNTNLTFTIPSETQAGSFCATFQAAKNLAQITIRTAGAITEGQYLCQNMFSSAGVISADLSSVTSVSAYGQVFSRLFMYASSLTTVDFSGLVSVNTIECFNYAFYSCSSLTTVKFDSLKTLNGQSMFTSAFYNCTSLQTIEFPSLESVTSNGNPVFQGMFGGCTALKTAKFNKLKTINCPFSNSYDQPFYNCPRLESVEFGGLLASTFASRKNQIQYLFGGGTGSQAPNGCTVHFPSNFDPSDPNHTFDASKLTGYPTFGGSASYIHVAFDLPATE